MTSSANLEDSDFRKALDRIFFSLFLCIIDKMLKPEEEKR